MDAAESGSRMPAHHYNVKTQDHSRPNFINIMTLAQCATNSEAIDLCNGFELERQLTT